MEKGGTLMDGLQTNKKINSYIIDSQEAEIKRIALELHEGVGQNLYSILKIVNGKNVNLLLRFLH